MILIKGKQMPYINSLFDPTQAQMKRSLGYTDIWEVCKQIKNDTEPKVIAHLYSQLSQRPQMQPEMTMQINMTLLHPFGKSYEVIIAREPGAGITDFIEYLTAGEGKDDSTREQWIVESAPIGLDKPVTIGHLKRAAIAITNIQVGFFVPREVIPGKICTVLNNPWLVPPVDQVVDTIISKLNRLFYSDATVSLTMETLMSTHRTQTPEKYYRFSAVETDHPTTNIEIKERSVLIPNVREKGELFGVTYRAPQRHHPSIAETTWFYASPRYTEWSADKAAVHIYEFLTAGRIDGDAFP
jgi:hypothetical protein